MEKVRIAIAGVGNCAACLVQGVQFYRENGPLGLMTEFVGPYGPGSVDVVAAFDVSDRKVGTPLTEAIWCRPNCPPTICTVDGPENEVLVTGGPLLDGIGESASGPVGRVASGNPEEVVKVLQDSGADVLVNFLPVGSTLATRLYADLAISADCAFVNAIPVPLATTETYQEHFRHACLPLIGDDVKSQVGATIVHRMLTEAFSGRAELTETYQLNVGGNMDFRNMQDPDRLQQKLDSKAASIDTVANGGRGVPRKYVGPAGLVDWLEDTKIAFIRMQGVGFGGNRIEVEARFSGADSPNSAGVVYDAVRYAKLAKDAGRGGVLLEACAWLMKNPPQPMEDVAAREHYRAVAESWEPEVAETEPAR